MLFPIKVVDIELSKPIPTFEELEGYMGLQGLVRLHGVPLGYVKAPITLGCCTAAILSKLILEQHNWAIICQLLKNGLASPERPDELTLEALIDLPPVEYTGEWPLVTVAVCTRDRPEDMKLCLGALCQLDYPRLDILVVDNAPTTEATKELIETHYPQVRYVREPRPGLDWARNRAILEAKGEIIAYTDDDVVVDPGWVKGLAQVFAENPDVMAVTGLVAPYELETEAQVLFEEYGGFGKGFERKEYRVPDNKDFPWWMCGAGLYGTGANMAYRRTVFHQIGFFDPSLDVGTVTNGGGDLEMFFRIVKEGYTLVYQPKSIARHRHRKDYESLKKQIINNGVGLYSFLVRSVLAYPRTAFSILQLGLYWFLHWNIRRAWMAFKHPMRIPPDLIWGEFWGSLTGLVSYFKAKKNTRKLIAAFGTQEAEIKVFNSLFQSTCIPQKADDRFPKTLSDTIAVRRISLENPLQLLDDVQAYPAVRIFVTWNSELLGHLDLNNRFMPISTQSLAEKIVEHLITPILTKLFSLNSEIGSHFVLSQELEKYYVTPDEERSNSLPSSVKVTINLATYDRPDDLYNCLKHLRSQNTNRDIEIVVVDNHPESLLTPPVVANFPGVKLISEPRQGLAYARNTGFIASKGDIIIATDDDVTPPPDWLEKIIAPFTRADVGIVTGNVLPLQLETSSQQLFEKYGGLGKGYKPFEVGLNWFEGSPRYAAPTWKLGATANSAFRATILAHPNAGLMDEALGPGMPSGVGEDTYLFYKAIKAGFTLVYQPSAFVWHKHRSEPSALRRQIYGYSKGHISYNLTTWLKDRDWRGIYQIVVGLSIYHIFRIFKWLTRKEDYPISLIGLEILGNLAGPWSLWQSYLRVQREGRSGIYTPAYERLQTPKDQVTKVADLA